MKLKKASICLMSTFLGITSIMSFLPTSLNASAASASTTAAAEGHTSFSKKWSKDISLDVNVGGNETAEVTMTIGFDTWAQDEDYVDDY